MSDHLRRRKRFSLPLSQTSIHNSRTAQAAHKAKSKQSLTTHKQEPQIIQHSPLNPPPPPFANSVPTDSSDRTSVAGEILSGARPCIYLRGRLPLRDFRDLSRAQEEPHPRLRRVGDRPLPDADDGGASVAVWNGGGGCC